MTFDKTDFDAQMTAYEADQQRALSLVRSREFSAGPCVIDIDPIYCVEHVNRAIIECAAYYRQFFEEGREYNQWAKRFTGSDGMTDYNRIPNAVKNRAEEVDHLWHSALDRLGDHIDAEVLLTIRDALELVGVTDWNIVCEIARCAMRGGTPKLSIPKIPIPKIGSADTGLSLVSTDAFHCPHCGHETNPDSLRCGVCRRTLSLEVAA